MRYVICPIVHLLRVVTKTTMNLPNPTTSRVPPTNPIPPLNLLLARYRSLILATPALMAKKALP